MPSEDAARILQTILHNIGLARRFVEGHTLESFAADERTIYAVTRCLEIVSEASRRLPDDIKARHPAIPWTQIAGSGNVYRHDYEDVLASLLWNTVHKHLGGLEQALGTEINRQTTER
ncbi:HepT-like ribonuclease domain-containing protein [Mesorhizobium sp. Z1-4]|uniref:HepT-like ribonuclease domain-containing protein n=1 Tax=Mesorhizobium sp. Z1-4 TaxID=2448478 RepID=UPI000FDC0479|nr:HepT-like ribonuclease domain-containing protein [Mesorhizobium sp. Z1-4]